jgi:acyl carrier protein
MPNETLGDIKLEVKKLIIQTLNFKDVKPEEIIDNVSFFTGENTIKIDSIDALEIVLEVQRRFKVRINNQNLARVIINSVDSISEFVYAEHNKTDSALL